MKYPKLVLLIVTFLLAYFILRGEQLKPIHDFLVASGYLGTFLAGVGYSFGFTAGPATAVLLILSEHQSIPFAGFLGGLGALLGDLLIFRFIRYSFRDETEKLSREKIFVPIRNMISGPIERYVLPAIGFFIIASPLPDEIGVSLLASATPIQGKMFTVLSYVLNTAGIFAVLLIGRL